MEPFYTRLERVDSEVPQHDSAPKQHKSMVPEMEVMVSEMEISSFLRSFGYETVASARVEAVFMVSEMVLVVSEMLEPGYNPRRYWVCGVPSLY